MSSSEAQANETFARFPEDFQRRVLKEGDAIGAQVISYLASNRRPPGLAGEAVNV